MTAPVLFATFLVMPSPAQRYQARPTQSDGVAVVELSDRETGTIVSIAPTVGNNAFEMKVNGKNLFWFPYESVADFAAQPKLCGNPLLAPWANRLDGDTFYANGESYRLKPEIGNIRRDGNQLPIHGLLLFSAAWEVMSLEATADEAQVISRLDFSKQESLVAQFPFSHVIEMAYVLRGGKLKVRTRITNTGSQTMPLSVGYHPYFQIHDAPRARWRVRLPVASRWLLNDKLIPTGDTQPIREVFSDPGDLQLADTFLDNVFGSLVRDQAGEANFRVKGTRQSIEVVYGPKYRTAVVYAPRREEDPFICFEPMSGITNAFNLAHRGVYKDLQTIPPGGVWEESFRIEPSGF